MTTTATETARSIGSTPLFGNPVLVCQECGRKTEALTYDQVVNYMETGWPKCCGRLMMPKRGELRVCAPNRMTQS